MNINQIIQEMTLEEKASLCSGADFWHTEGFRRLGVPKLMVSDGPHGLRKQSMEGDHLGINDSIKAVCFPTGCTVASSFDKELIYEMGETLGNECQAEGVGILLGPAMNIKRSPLCGRNFEYFSEDPYLSTTLAAAQVKGIQSKNVGASIKHFLANNQEHRRMSSDSQVDERTLREIYLASFEGAVKEAKPWTVMCSYNKVNGYFASENYEYLTGILRDEWGFDGFVVSDWGAVSDRVAGVKAGLDLEMPSSGGVNDKKIIEAVKNGSLNESVVDQTVKRILTIVDKFENYKDSTAIFDRDADHEMARKIAGESMVLLKNDDILPLKKSAKVAFIGEFAKKPRFQGGGSSHINCHKISNALDQAVDAGIDVSYAQGYSLAKDQVDLQLIEEATAVAAQSEVAVIFVGLPDSYESEGYDRKHMGLPESHNKLIESVTKAQEKTVIVLHNGSPVEMPWVNEVKGVLEAYLSGQAVGAATVDILFGDVNPSGKLAETLPIRMQDNPSYLYYFGEKDVVEYREGIFVGYRYYDKKEMSVLFPFGHGLSYTSFKYDKISVDHKTIDANQLLTVSVQITNSGQRVGKEVVQLYVTPSRSGTAIRPIKELKGYEKVSLKPGESKLVSFTLDKRSFAYYNTSIKDWYVEEGVYGIEVGGSSRNIQLREEINVTSDVKLPEVFDMNSIIGDIMLTKKGAALIDPFLKGLEEVFGGDDENAGSEAITEDMKMAMIRDMPLRTLAGFSNGAVTETALTSLIAKMNA